MKTFNSRKLSLADLGLIALISVVGLFVAYQILTILVMLVKG